jgi:hypothetical protein
MIVCRVVSGYPKKGLIWHFQGLGKSLLMVFASQKLRMHPKLKNPSVMIVVGRIDLDPGDGPRCPRRNPRPEDPKKAKEIEITPIPRLRRHPGNPKFVALGERLEKLKERHEQGLMHSIEFPILTYVLTGLLHGCCPRRCSTHLPLRGAFSEVCP